MQNIWFSYMAQIEYNPGTNSTFLKMIIAIVKLSIPLSDLPSEYEDLNIIWKYKNDISN